MFNRKKGITVRLSRHARYDIIRCDNSRNKISTPRNRDFPKRVISASRKASERRKTVFIRNVNAIVLLTSLIKMVSVSAVERAVWR